MLATLFINLEREVTFDSLFPTLERFSMEEIGADTKFKFCCDSSQPCFNQCCSEAIIPLTPFDVMRLCQNLCLASEDFLINFTTSSGTESGGLALPMLRMIDSPDAPCPFVSPGGCSVYEDRPGACRSYPVARGINPQDMSDKYFLLKEACCHGFENSQEYTPKTWLEKEDCAKFDKYAAQYARLVAKLNTHPHKERLNNLFFLCLFQLDRFRQFIDKMRLFSRVPASAEEKIKIMENSPEGNEACLDFAFRWLNQALDSPKAGN